LYEHDAREREASHLHEQIQGVLGRRREL
jgi:hypothetical protein